MYCAKPEPTRTAAPSPRPWGQPLGALRAPLLACPRPWSRGLPRASDEETPPGETSARGPGDSVGGAGPAAHPGQEWGPSPAFQAPGGSCGAGALSGSPWGLGRGPGTPVAGPRAETRSLQPSFCDPAFSASALPAFVARSLLEVSITRPSGSPSAGGKSSVLSLLPASDVLLEASSPRPGPWNRPRPASGGPPPTPGLPSPPLLAWSPALPARPRGSWQGGEERERASQSRASAPVRDPLCGRHGQGAVGPQPLGPSSAAAGEETAPRGPALGTFTPARARRPRSPHPSTGHTHAHTEGSARFRCSFSAQVETDKELSGLGFFF